ncbi:MAG: ShlB/FhaC/HecB family hemolysin secretion/activation protein [Magnetococcales bacterium]|nr:ShlB/FhaC/HecB family hemolysin secretion/activation protein [Magnetococcales bacterium]
MMTHKIFPLRTPHSRQRLGTMVLASLMGVPTGLATANTPDDSLDGGVQSEIQRRADTAVQTASLPPSKKTVIRAAMPKLSTSLTRLKLSIGDFRVEGLSEVSADAIDQVLEPWKGREITFPQFEEAVHAVVAYLRAHGHPQAEVKLSRAVVGGGKVAVAIQGLTVPVTQLALKPEGEPVVPRIEVNAFRVTGVTIVSQEEIDELLKPMTGKALSIDEIKQASEMVASHLRAKGYPLVQAFLPPQKIDSGRIEIAVQEGVVDGSDGSRGVRVEGGGTLVKNEVIADQLASGVNPGLPLRLDNLERAVLLANDLPGIKSVKTTLEPGSLTGSTQVVAKVEETGPVTGTVWGDNYGSRYTGANRLNAQININSLSGMGERVSVNAAKASGMTSGKVAVQVPLGSTGAKLGTSYSQLVLDIDEEIVPLSLSSETSVASLFGSYPLVRSSKQNVWLTANYDAKHVANRFNGDNLNDRRIGLYTFGASGDLIDVFDGQMGWSAGYGLGNLNLGGNTAYQATDAGTAQTEGHFGKLNWSLQRKQQLDAALSWTVAVNGMIGSKNLDSAEKFQLGGPTGVRAYPIGEGLGDSGWLGTTEVRYSFGQTDLGEPQLFTFFDTGRITQYDHLWEDALSAGTPNDYRLSGVGVGAALVSDERGGVNLTWAKKVGSNPNPTSSGTDSDGTSKNARIWIFGNILF